MRLWVRGWEAGWSGAGGLREALQVRAAAGTGRPEPTLRRGRPCGASRLQGALAPQRCVAGLGVEPRAIPLPGGCAALVIATDHARWAGRCGRPQLSAHAGADMVSILGLQARFGAIAAYKPPSRRAVSHRNPRRRLQAASAALQP